jgi:hypothetical protein
MANTTMDTRIENVHMIAEHYEASVKAGNILTASEAVGQLIGIIPQMRDQIKSAQGSNAPLIDEPVARKHTDVP